MNKIRVFILAFLFLSLSPRIIYGQGEYHVEYEVTGSAEKVNITISIPGGGTEQFSDVRTRWHKDFYFDEGEFLYVAAQNLTNSGEVIVKYIRTGMESEFAQSYVNHIVASYSLDTDKESGELGYDDGIIKSEHYKKLFKESIPNP